MTDLLLDLLAGVGGVAVGASALTALAWLVSR
jgi:hypothetical protein